MSNINKIISDIVKIYTLYCTIPRFLWQGNYTGTNGGPVFVIAEIITNISSYLS